MQCTNGQTIDKDITKHIDNWTAMIETKIDEILAHGEKPVIITVPRKMPRFLHWIMHSYLQDERRNVFLNKMRHCILTTQYAIPFISNQLLKKPTHVSSNPEDERNVHSPKEPIAIASSEPATISNVIIVDDSSVSGKSLLEVSLLVKTITNMEPFCSAVFMCDKSLAANTESYATIPKTEMGKYLDFVAKTNRKSSLPIDMEFPILHDIAKKSSIAKTFQGKEGTAYGSPVQTPAHETANGRHNPTNIIYRVDHCDNNEQQSSISVVLNEEHDWGYNNDFAKIRIIDSYRGSGTKIVAYCPNVLSTFDLKDEHLFVNPEYADIWHCICNAMDTTVLPEMATNKVRTIAANYLYSLSCLIRNKNVLGTDTFADFDIDFRDLCLIFGPDLSLVLKDKISNIIHKEIISPSKHGRYESIPIRIIPTRHSAGYEIRTSNILTKNANSNIDVILDNIFRLSHYSDGMFAQDGLEYYTTYVSETFSSLSKMLATINPGEEIEREIHHWIDKRIDEGIIVPMYHRVDTEKGAYWKRFFNLSNAAPLL